MALASSLRSISEEESTSFSSNIDLFHLSAGHTSIDDMWYGHRAISRNSSTVTAFEPLPPDP